MSIYIDLIYRINHLFCIILSSIRGKTPLSMNRYDKFIEFLLIIHRFQFETIYPQELVVDYSPRRGSVLKFVKLSS